MRINIRAYSCVLAVSVVLVGCSSASRFDRLNLNEVLDTSILDNGTKQFEYTLQMPKRYQMDARRSSNNRRQSREEYEYEFSRYAKRRLGELLVQREYCRKGFMTYDQLYRQDRLFIRGECKDGAVR